jgi:iron complex outermembrane receptor protein
MAGIDVYKAATADLIEGGTGGQIDLRTKMPFDFNRFELQTSANADYADFRKKTSPTGSALITDTWDTGGAGRIGVLVDLAYGKYSARTDFMSVEPYYKTLVDGIDRYIPGGFDYGTQDYDRTRKGAYAAVQWQPIENLELTQTYFESKYQQTTVEQDVFMDTTTLTANPSGSVFDPSGGLSRSSDLFVYNPASLGTPSGTITGGGVTALSAYSSDTRDLSTTFKFNGGRWTLRGGFQQVDSSTHTLSYDVFPTVPFAANGFGLDLTGVAELTVPAATQAALSNPNDYTYEATRATSQTMSRGSAPVTRILTLRSPSQDFSARSRLAPAMPITRRRTRRPTTTGRPCVWVGTAVLPSPLHRDVPEIIPPRPSQTSSRAGSRCPATCCCPAWPWPSGRIRSPTMLFTAMAI